MIMRIKPFRLLFGSITDRDNQGKVTGASNIDRDKQASFSLIITDESGIRKNYHTSGIGKIFNF